MSYSQMRKAVKGEAVIGDGKYEHKYENDQQKEGGDPVAPGEFRTLLPQLLASTAKNMILLDLGMTLAFPTIVIPALLKAQVDPKFTEEQASWFASITFICQPLGSVISGLIFEPIGRKKAMILLNIPHIIGWFLLYAATSVEMLYAASLIMGIGVGFMEAPILTYVGEISQPKWRGILTSFAGIFVTFGFCFVYFVGTLSDWRTTAAICSSVPMIAIIVIFQVPESPMWLISKGRLEEAEKSLCWLRGWVTPEIVQKEFKELVKYDAEQKKSKKQLEPSNSPIKTVSLETPEANDVGSVNRTLEVLVVKKSTLKKVLSFFHVDDLLRRQTFLPLMFLILFFFFHHAAGITGTRPFLVQIFEEFQSPIDAHWATVILSILAVIGNILCMCFVKRTGKRAMTLLSLSGCALVNFALAAYSLWFRDFPYKWTPVILFMLLNFIWIYGIAQIPWMLTSEVFPMRGRGLASGVAAGAAYVLGFVFSKTYLNLYNNFTLAGVFCFYGLCSFLGFVLFYFILPETEGKTLEDIEEMFENKFQKMRRKNNNNVL